MLTIADGVALSLLSHGTRLAALDVLRTHPDALLPDVVSAALPGPLPDGFVAELRARSSAILASPKARGVAAVAWGQPGYPPLLTSIPDAPFVAWFKGSLACLRRPAVAIVGSRAATPYGLEAASQLACDLAGAGVVVVSGLARGIDSAAHRAALSGGGDTVAVLGSGVDCIYPAEHLRLAAEVAANGAVVSEFLPGTVPAPRNFPARNRIISGLAQVVVVVEAAERSGSLITAACALEQGREVMAVPGNILSGRHRGCHALIRDGAAVVESADDVLAALQASRVGGVEGRPGAPPDDPVLAGLVPGEALDVEALSAGTGLPASQLLSRLLELELRGSVTRVDGGRFVRAGRTC